MGYEGLTTEPNPGGGEYTLERLVWPSGREINGYPFTTFTDFFRLSWDDTWSLVRIISNITNNITNSLANITNSLTNSITYIPANPGK